jgi:UrcA family protein
MRVPSLTKYGLGLGFLAVALGIGVATASAQGTPYSNGPTESVEVIGPRFHAVRYDDLDIATRSGAHALRWRIWNRAHEVCGRLSEVYPVYEMTTAKSCVKTAYEDAIVKAYRAIADARLSYWYGY